MVYTSFTIYLESPVFSSFTWKVSCWLFGRESHSVFISLNSTQKRDSCVAFSAMRSYLGIPFVMQMGFQIQAQCRFLSWHCANVGLKKYLKSRSPFPVPNCRVNGQEYRWGSRPTPYPTRLTPWEPSNERKGCLSTISHGVISNLPQLPLARVVFCVVFWTRKNSLTGWACAIRVALSKDYIPKYSGKQRPTIMKFLFFIKRELNQWPFICMFGKAAWPGTCRSHHNMFLGFVFWLIRVLFTALFKFLDL